MPNGTWHPERHENRDCLLLVVALAVALGVMMHPVRASAEAARAPEAVRTVLEERYAALKLAMAHRDREALAAVLAADFLSEDASGKTTTFDQMLQELAAVPKDQNRISETTVLSVQLVGNVATARQRYHMRTTKLAPDGATRQAVEMVALSIDTWVLANGAWLLQRTVTEQMDYKVDGRLVLHRERSGRK